ncbi:DUF2878 domain-containing protein [Shewanella sp. UCD-KL12]|uniref:DUF2878 domain-containing protein n=1 Tax=Shewanella sp. UCD-KL12 TaxID=1917163 RepID=UPI0009702F4D|nr:DUF2878 domain-containing protein [Shewanella sp. UCD-KL12]
MKRFWLINLVLFQATWFVSAIYTDRAWPYLLAIVLVHFLLSPTTKKDSRLLILMPIGVVVDKVLMDLGVFYTSAEVFPFWLMLIWCMFIISFNHSLKWLMAMPLALSALIGAIAGPLSYRLGAELGALEWGVGELNGILILAAIWGVLLPSLVCGYRYLNLEFDLASKGEL